MDLSKLAQRTLRVSRGFTYNYHTSRARDSKPTLILFHGWPDTARLWSGLINNYLIPHGYGVVALDCLGYGGTSKPTDPSVYSWQHMTADAIEILDHEDLGKVISLGHDWGSVMAQRFYDFNPTRVCGLGIVNVSYVPPTGKFDLQATNDVTKKAFGAGIYEYWWFFTADDGASIMNRNLESVYSVAFAEPQTWLDTFCTPGGMREFISQGRTQPTLPYATPEHKADFMERFGRDGGFEAPCCWYKAFAGGVQNEADASLGGVKPVNVPVLYWGGEQDFVCRPALLDGSVKAGLRPKLKAVTREGGHWALLEKPEEFGQDVLDWLQVTFT